MEIKFIDGEQVYLRPVEAEDADIFCQWFNDPEFRKLGGGELPTSKHEQKKEIERMHKGENAVWLVITLRDTNNPIGFVVLGKIDRVNRNAQFGIGIGDKTHWARGYGTEAAKLVVDYGFNTLNLHRIWLEVYDYNKRAIRSYEKVGFRAECTLRDGEYVDGKYHDLVVMSILENEWNR